LEDHAIGPEPAVARSLETEAWDELRRLAEKHRSLTDPDLAAALEAMLVSKAQSLALSAKSKPDWVAEFPLLAAILAGVREGPRGASSATSGETYRTNRTDQTDPIMGIGDSDQSDSSDPSDSSNPSNPADPSAPPAANDLELAERLIRDAHIASMRGDKAKAKEILDQAEKAAPTAAPVLVALGDAALERHNIKEAVRLYGLAKDAEPGNVAIEKKHADAVFRLSQGMVFDPTARSGGVEAAASAKAATFMSALLPGLGQIVLGDFVKGIVLMVGYLGGWTVAALIGFQGLFALMGMNTGVNPSPIVLLPLAMAAIFYLVAVNDAAARSKLAAKRPIVRPVPPSDLPFE